MLFRFINKCVTKFIKKLSEITKEYTYIHHTQGILYLSFL